MGQDVFEIFQGAIIDALEEAKAKKKSQSQTRQSKSEKSPEDSDDCSATINLSGQTTIILTG